VAAGRASSRPARMTSAMTSCFTRTRSARGMLEPARGRARGEGGGLGDDDQVRARASSAMSSGPSSRRGTRPGGRTGPRPTGTTPPRVPVGITRRARRRTRRNGRCRERIVPGAEPGP
jgi:hypothetical protein